MMRRQPMASTGFSLEVKALITARARHLCERCGYGNSTVQIHHRRPRGMGGTKRLETNLPSAGVLLCQPCHAEVESHRLKAYSDGWLVRQHQSPLDAPLYRRGHWVLLDDDGTFERLPAPHVREAQ